MKISDVFKTKGIPNYTYVSVTDGKYEDDLAEYILDSGTLCLVTGPSKTGKTVLVSQVCSRINHIPLEVRCVQTLTVEEFWRRALEQINFARIREISAETATEATGKGTITGALGWKWLASAQGEIAGEISRTRSEEEVREKILAAPCAQHLLPLLSKCNVLLIIEDFHYLTPEVQKAIFQEWKLFVDKEVSVVVLETTQHSCDLAYANKDLVGRVGHIQLTTWLKSDLQKIATLGFKALNVNLNERAIEFMAEESAGLPIIMQSVCAEFLRSRSVKARPPQPATFSVCKGDLYGDFHHVITRHYAQFHDIYHNLRKGLREDKRRYKTYECILSAFGADPIAFSLSRAQLRARVEALPLPKSRIPPNGSIKHALEHLRQLQDKIGVTMLEWVERQDKLYVVEPAFLFYLRWLKPRNAEPDVYDILAELMEGIVVTRSGKKGAQITVTFGSTNKRIERDSPPVP